MPRAEKPELVDWLYRCEFDRPVQLREVLDRGARDVLHRSEDVAEAFAESNLNIFWNYLLARQEQDERRGLSRVYKVMDGTARTLSWCGVGDPSPVSVGTSYVRLRLRHRPAVLRMIDELNDREYEALACVVSGLAGATHVALTPAGNEGGVDFFALLPTPGRCHLFSGNVHPLRIVGQCKKYSDPISLGRLKEFLETLEDVKHRGEPKIERLVPPWFHSMPGPILGFMIGHSGFQSGATTKARNHGIVLADTLDLAEIISLSRQLPGDHATARVEACLRRLHQFLQPSRPGTVATPS
jgi:hypothetical protein